jgi:hypothetical protein
MFIRDPDYFNPGSPGSQILDLTTTTIKRREKNKLVVLHFL